MASAGLAILLSTVLSAFSLPLSAPARHYTSLPCPAPAPRRYLVNDVLKAKCEAPIRVELIDRASGQPLSEDLPDVVLEVGGVCGGGVGRVVCCGFCWLGPGSPFQKTCPTWHWRRVVGRWGGVGQKLCCLK